MPVYMELGDIKGNAASAASADAQPYLQIEMANVLVSNWQTSAAHSSDTQPNPPSWGLDRIDQSAPGGGGGTGKVSVHDISISKHVGGADNVEVTLKVLDDAARSGTGTHEVGHWLDTTTPFAPVTERESGLVYSGESGGMNAASVPQFSGGVFVAAGNSAAPPEVPPVHDFSISKQTDHEGAFYLKLQGVDGDSASLPPQGQATLTMFTADYAGDGESVGVKLPDVLVTSWQSSAADQSAAGSFFAYDAGFRGGVSVAVSDAAPGGYLYLGTDQGVFGHGGIDGGDLGHWQSNYGAVGSAAPSGGGGDDVLIGGYGGDVPAGNHIGDTAVHEVGHWMGLF